MAAVGGKASATRVLLEKRAGGGSSEVRGLLSR